MSSLTAPALVAPDRVAEPVRRTPRPDPRPASRAVQRPAARPAPRAANRPDPRPASRAARPLPSRQVLLRRRAAVGAVVVALAGGALALGFGVGQAGAGIEGPPASTPIYVVQPGDTLWDIANRLAPEVDTARAVAELRRVAGGPALVPGQRLAVPAALR